MPESCVFLSDLCFSHRSMLCLKVVFFSLTYVSVTEVCKPASCVFFSAWEKNLHKYVTPETVL